MALAATNEPSVYLLSLCCSGGDVGITVGSVGSSTGGASPPIPGNATRDARTHACACTHDVEHNLTLMIRHTSSWQLFSKFR